MNIFSIRIFKIYFLYSNIQIILKKLIFNILLESNLQLIKIIACNIWLGSKMYDNKIYMHFLLAVIIMKGKKFYVQFLLGGGNLVCKKICIHFLLNVQKSLVPWFSCMDMIKKNYDDKKFFYATCVQKLNGV